jgi:hypothetical protein
MSALSDASNETMTAAGLAAASFDGLPLARYEIRLRAGAEAQLPRFPGSALRGAFGHALKQAVCVMPHGDCPRCLVASRCLYPYVFETPWPPQAASMQGQQHAPHPFVLRAPVFPREQRVEGSEPGRGAEVERSETANNAAQAASRKPQAGHTHTLAAGAEITFGLTLLGRAIEQLPYLVFAVHELAERGLSVRRHKFALSEVVFLAPAGERQTLYTEATARLETPPNPPPTLADYVHTRLQQWHSARADEASSEEREARSAERGAKIADTETPLHPCTPAPLHPFIPHSLRLRFLTPTRLKTGGQLQWRADFRLLARSLLRRVSQAQMAHGAGPLDLDYRGLLARAEQVTVWGEAVRWWDWGRYSNRQQTGMKLGGFVGPLGLRGAALAEFLPLLVAGEVLGVGSGTSFGLGEYCVERVFSKTDRGLPDF